MVGTYSECDLSLLLNPISEKEVCGESLRYTDVYDKIKQGRREDDQKLPQGVWKADLKKADWDKVDSLCQEALIHKSKDLQIAIWFMEARLHLEGINGIASGIELILKLTQMYWDGLYPQGNELRQGLYEWINLRFSEEIHLITISKPSDKTVAYRLLDLNEANRKEFSKDNKGTKEEGAFPSLNKISASITQTPTTYYLEMDKICTLIMEFVSKLEEELVLRFSAEAPTFYHLKDKIQAVQKFARHVLDVRNKTLEEKKLINTTEHAFKVEEKSLLNSIENREQAYAILKEVAAYLETIEPHSPTPYLIHRAISWGKMNLPQVVSGVLNEGGSLALLLDILNVKENSPNPTSQQRNS